MSTDQVEQLLREGVAAARTGDKETARQKLEEVVSLDPQSEKGWFWLANVVETDEEKRTCLGNVIVLNPQNNQARAMLKDLDKAARDSEKAAKAESKPAKQDDAKGAKGGNLRILLLGIIGVLAVVMVLVMLRPKPSAPAAAPTQVAGLSAASTTPTGPTSTPTVTPFVLPSSRPTLPPSWTPAPTNTRVGLYTTTPLPLPPPDVSGHLLGISGNILTLDGMLPLFIIDPIGTNFHQLTTDETRGDFATFKYPDGQQIFYSRYDQDNNSGRLALLPLGGGNPQDMEQMWGGKPFLTQEQQPSVSRIGNALVFSAANLSDNDDTAGIYYLPLAQGGGTGLSRVTPRSTGENTWPALSPDGTLVVFVAQGLISVNNQTDLVIMGLNGATPPGGSNAPPTAPPPGSTLVDTPSPPPPPPPGASELPVIGGAPKNLTNDGDANIEAAPEFSPDGGRIAFESAPNGQKNHSIFIINVDGTNLQPLVQGPGDNIRPHWSPDGRFIAFSSTRSGKWEIYIVEVATGNLYQVTQTKADVTICTAWGP